MDTYRIELDPAAASFYQKVAASAGIGVEQVLADALYRLAGSLAMDAICKNLAKN